MKVTSNLKTHVSAFRDRKYWVQFILFLLLKYFYGFVEISLQDVEVP